MTNLYKRVIVKGVPSVPLSSISQKCGKGFKGTVLQKKGGNRPTGAIFFDKSTNIWVKQDEYDSVAEYVRTHEKFVMRDILTVFTGSLKSYKVKAVIHRLQEEGLLAKKSGGLNIWTYYPIVKKPTSQESLADNLVCKLSDEIQST